MKQVYLLTGKPGTGKTSLIKQAVASTGGKAGGFYTEEIRSGGARLGFRLVTLDGESAILSHVNIHSPYQVSKYGVDIDNLDRVGVSALYKAAEECDLVIIDEIGKMELFSANFREAVSQIIDSRKRVLGTIMLNANPWADAIKHRPQVNLITLTRVSYPQVLEGLLRWLKATESLKL
ncbi:Nucleoside-triphosphatase THEP1 [subsurface metagenome]